ncbi:MAG: hypothetical protein J6M53_09820 [Bacteroidaceae bacterium]|nr:hypothetical protein [Bacteroidaceae bacterium]
MAQTVVYPQQQQAGAASLTDDGTAPSLFSTSLVAASPARWRVHIVGGNKVMK